MKLPEDCPAYPSLRIRNTFIDTTAERSPSLERFYREREVSTCPSAHIGRLRGLFQEADVDTAWTAADEADTRLPSEHPDTTSVSEASPCDAAGSSAFVISLAEALAPPYVPSIGAARGGLVVPGRGRTLTRPSAVPAALEPLVAVPPQLPSAGSVSHASGECKPCAFFHTVGCTSGVHCEFCHLCDSEERRKRRKAKYEARRAAKLRNSRSAARDFE